MTIQGVADSGSARTNAPGGERPVKRHESRIQVLDGFRAIAIALVIGFHYLVRWAPPSSSQSLYPYGAAFAGFPLFQYGYFGVELFFIVSGFVISLTLFSCSTWGEFAVKRLARLVPSMALCSLITFAMLSVLPFKLFTVSVSSFVPSLTFIDPYWWTWATGLRFDWMDGVYWSLAIEVKFYLWACLVFFTFKPRRFLVIWLMLLTVTTAAQLLAAHLHSERALGLIDLALFPNYMVWFVAGIGFYCLHLNRGDRLAKLVILETALILLWGWLGQGGPSAAYSIAFAVAFYLLFILYIYRPSALRVLGAPAVAAMGAASYSLYLLHQKIGVTLIALVAGWLGVRGAGSVAIAILVAFGLTVVAVGIYRLWEMPAKNWLLRLTGMSRRGARPLPESAAGPA